MNDEEFPPLSINDAVRRDQERRHDDRRKIERREPKQGVNVRHDDRDGYVPRRIRRANYSAGLLKK